MVEKIIGMREDLSNQLVHLTREYEGRSAKENLISILQQEIIEARNTDFLFKKGLPKEIENEFKVMSFTETPLEQLKNLTNITFKRKINLEPYGVIFSKKELLDLKVSPVHYLYQEDQRFFYKKIFNIYLSGKLDSALAILPFIKGIHEYEDFHWEREWKMVGDFCFSALEYSVIVPTVQEARKIYLKVFLPRKVDLTFYVLEINDWLYIHYYHNKPQSYDKNYVHLESGYEIFQIDSEKEKLINLKNYILENSKVPKEEFY